MVEVLLLLLQVRLLVLLTTTLSLRLELAAVRHGDDAALSAIADWLWG